MEGCSSQTVNNSFLPTLICESSCTVARGEDLDMRLDLIAARRSE